MAKGQGLLILGRGAATRLTPSERNRGYLFISTDKQVKRILGERAQLIVNGKDRYSKKMDKSGRIYIGRELTRSIGPSPYTLRMENGVLHLKF